MRVWTYLLSLYYGGMFRSAFRPVSSALPGAAGGITGVGWWQPER
jgi:hypothetical protein